MKTSILVALVALFAFAGAADAQITLPPLPFPLTGSTCSCVSDPPTEAATGQIAFSVTTGGGSGHYSDNSSYITRLDSTLTTSGGIANFATNYPGWQPLPNNSSQLAAQVTTDTMSTYASAVSDAQSQMSELEAESLSGLEQLSSSAQAVLLELQINAEVGFQIVNELKLIRQLLADVLLVEATHHAEELNERAQANATEAQIGWAQ